MATGSPYALSRLWHGLGLAACALLFALSLMPNPPSPDVDNADKYQHFIAYFMVGAWFAAIRAPRYGQAIVFSLALGAAIELAQQLTSYRHGDPWDMLANTAGVLAGAGFAWFGGMAWLGYIDQRVAANRNRAG